MNLPVKDAFILTELPGRDDRRRWIQRIIDHDGPEYFRARLTRQPKDIAHLLELVLNHATSRDQQCDVLRSLLAVELAYGKSS